MKEKEKITGITLISLVITIIILLILAGVSINILMGENGVLTKTQEAKVEYEISEEKEQVEIFVVSKLMNEKAEVDSSENLIGTKLTDKVVGINNTLWKIITEIEEGEMVETYGTGWYYIEKGTEIDSIEELKYSYIVNYNTGKVMKFDNNKHTLLENGMNIAVRDGIVFNADPTNMKDGSQDSWGDAIIHGFSGTEYNEDGSTKSGWTESALILDGIDDYIELYLDGDEFETGFSFEFYGKIYDYNRDSGFAMIHKGISYTMGCCFGAYPNQGSGNIWFGYQGHWYWNFDKSNWYDDAYLTLSCDNNSKTVNVYYNGVEKLVRKTTGSNTIEKWIEYLNNPNYPYKIGIGTWSNGTFNTKCNIYAARIYSKALDEQEVLANYNATVSYHELLTK